ncbi:5-formyltetrahydrofolate cyclo-ligase [bacterium D16-51]|nr:5-formyltetrahydrofolate cyclo-ligase [bacterium D16-59]RKI59765.1 5-formyltetrahydrofolate cyclo-ligase [bacterium D16-51]
MTKQEAREQMKQCRRKLSVQEREEKNRCIFQYLMKMEIMQQQKYFFPFVSYGTEVDTIQIIRQVLKEGKMKVAVPRVNRETEGEMDFFVITSMEDLSRGYQGILEPVTQEKIEASEGVMLLPGLAFDRQKNRAGYGGGYYDRCLGRYKKKSLVTVALAFQFQIVDRLETDFYDIRPDWIVTEQGVF